ncbi:hypothetical protein JK361_26315 [Streptomyces sp. 5-8]|uniref:DUF3558 domain-containing protein n=1 Tax=Streptomyces musisoli TaxID=2802280 RepID=A0ABS1P6R3_9ACTN|nr:MULTISPECIES: hypothetical protein [Streptomyces]MBL1108062.1 hypothetical protein [Streptomyces musisoli]MBY8841427.1 hypothetical protein [Streptomyces sp. SP2-10]
MHDISEGGIRSAVSLLGAALLVGLTASCSSPAPAREYAVPGDVCGTDVARSVLEPLLPAGQKISAEASSAVGVERCRISVDGEIVFSSAVEKHDANTTANDVASSAHGVDPADASANGGHVVYSKTGAVGLVECPASTSADSSLWATVRTSHEVKASAMRAFVEGYAAAVAESDACRDLTAR